MDALEEMIARLKQTHMQTNSTEHSTKNSSVCPICNGTGMKVFYKNDVCYMQECSCGILQKKIVDEKISFADIPKSFKGVTLNNFNVNAYKSPESRNKATLAIKGVNYWLTHYNAVTERGMGLYLYSKAKGSGKTRMAASIANELMLKKSCQVKFCTSLQILNEIKASWDRDNEYRENSLLDLLSRCEILVIDDFGTEQSDKPWINERFYQIINSRYIDKKITIFTSNKKLDLLTYDDRITNRIKERVFQIPFPEESVRDIIAEENAKELINGIKNEVSE